MYLVNCAPGSYISDPGPENLNLLSSNSPGGGHCAAMLLREPVSDNYTVSVSLMNIYGTQNGVPSGSIDHLNFGANGMIFNLQDDQNYEEIHVR